MSSPKPEPFNTSRVAVLALPKHVRIGPHTYTIERMEVMQSVGRGNSGEHSSSELRISIALESPNTITTAEVFWHEIMHAIRWVYDIKSGDNEERVVTRTAVGLTALFLDNPWLTGWLDQCSLQKIHD